MPISIHAPPRGATPSAVYSVSAHALFQFTPLREGRLKNSFFILIALLFQFTPLREGRHATDEEEGKLLIISIHAPPRGATRTRCANCKRTSFQFTPLREGRPAAKARRTVRRSHFNSRPSARGDDGGVARRNRRVISIHAPPRGATPIPRP